MGAERLLRFLAQRLVKAAIVVLAIVVFQFVLIRLAPGDPASVIAGQSGAADAEFMAQLRAQFGRLTIKRRTDGATRNRADTRTQDGRCRAVPGARSGAQNAACDRSGGKAGCRAVGIAIGIDATGNQNSRGGKGKERLE